MHPYFVLIFWSFIWACILWFSKLELGKTPSLNFDMELKTKLGKLGSIKVKIEEDEWLNQLRSCLETEASEVEDEVDRLSRSIVFNVPKELKLLKPEAFIPQAVSIGPYHHCRSELYEMERYKLAATRRFQDRCINPLNKKFEDTVVAELKSMDWHIRNYYDKYLDCKSGTLAWLMAVDGVFVLESIQILVKQIDKDSDIKQLGRVLDPSRKTSTHNAVFRDLMMLENQIPLLVVKKLLQLQLGCEEKAERRLSRLLYLTVSELSPFTGLKLSEEAAEKLSKRGHILEAVYFAFVPIADSIEQGIEEEKIEEIMDTEDVVVAVSWIWKTISSTNVKPVKKAVNSARNLSLKLFNGLGKLPVLKSVKGPISLFFNNAKSFEENSKKNDDDADSVIVVEIPPTRDELVVPSISSLHAAGVKFASVDGGITSIRFDETLRTLYLPKLRIDCNTDVLVRNLVAFESAVAPSGAMAFTRYMDFINGVIDNADDVRILRNSGVISHHLQNDLEVANLWNGMGGCVRLTKVGYLDKAVEDLNRFYSRSWTVRMMDMIHSYVFGSWQILSLSAGVMLLCLTALQAFCSVYDCQKWFDPNLG